MIRRTRQDERHRLDQLELWSRRDRYIRIIWSTYILIAHYTSVISCTAMYYVIIMYHIDCPVLYCVYYTALQWTMLHCAVTRHGTCRVAEGLEWERPFTVVEYDRYNLIQVC